MKPLVNLPEQARRQFAEIGPVWGRDIPRHRDLVLQAYRPLLAAAPKAGVSVTHDIAYGSNPRQVLDIYRQRGRTNAPVVIFLHGGFWRAAYDRSHTGPLATALAAAGYVLCVPEFRRTGQPGGVRPSP